MGTLTEQQQTTAAVINAASLPVDAAPVAPEAAIVSAAMGSGWLPPTPDPRDYTDERPEIKKITKKLKLPKSTAEGFEPLPPKVDLRKWCSPVRDQGDILQSCTAFAGVGIIEYFEKRAFSKSPVASPQFLYKCTRDIRRVKGDTGAEIRDVMKALVLFGVPGETYCPYIMSEFDNEPTPFLYAMAGNYKAGNYFCHDPLGKPKRGKDILYSVKQYLAAGIPAMFGLGLPSPFTEVNIKGAIPFCKKEVVFANHALVAVGYNDSLRIRSASPDVKPTKGALLVRNCKGPKWGRKGYGWLPYQYVLSKRARDFWSLLSVDWIDTGNFGLEDPD